MTTITAELTARQDRIAVFFPFDTADVRAIKTVLGARFVPANKSKTGQAHWTVPADLDTGRDLRKLFGRRLVLGPALRAWGQEQVQRRATLDTIANASSATLSRLPERLPKLYQAIHIGPKGRWMTAEERTEALAGEPSFQSADVAFMALQDSSANFSEMGLGKTLTTIGAIFESGMEKGPKLVVGPVAAIESTWPTELETWQDLPVYLSSGTAAQKAESIGQFMNAVARGEDPWLLVNPDQIRMREEFAPCDLHSDLDRSAKAKKHMRECPECAHEYVAPFPELIATEWSAVVLDEAHDFGVMNPKKLTGMGVKKLRTVPNGKRVVLTGTPMRGKEINLFPILQWLQPKVHTSKWRWAERYLEVGHNGFGRTIGGVKRCNAHAGDEQRIAKGMCEACDGNEREFYRALSPYVVRRTKAECLPWLPPVQHVELWCDFASAKHAKQYRQFVEEAAIVINNETVQANTVLAEYARLKRLAWGVADIVDGNLVPTAESGKLAVLEQRLAELGIMDGTSDEQVVIFSQSDDVVDLVTDWLVGKGVPAASLTGSTGRKGERGALQKAFQSDDEGLRVLVITTKAGGTSLTLDRASNVFILDEMWNPDDQDQAIGRCHRASRIHQVTAWWIRTRGTIEENIAEANIDKDLRNASVMDLRKVLAGG